MTNQLCGIDTLHARGYVCHSDSSGISFYLDKGVGLGWIEAYTMADVFGANFDPDSFGGGRNFAYQRGSHFLKRFPEDFR